VAVRRQCRRPSGTHSADGGTSVRVAARSDVAAPASNGGGAAAPVVATGSGDIASASSAGMGGAEAVADPPRSPAAPPQVVFSSPPQTAARACVDAHAESLVPAGATSGGGGAAAMAAACGNRRAAAAAAAKSGRSLRLPSHEPPTSTSARLRRPTDGTWPSPPAPQSPLLAAQGGGDVAWATATATASWRQRRWRRRGGGGRRCGDGRGRGGGRCHPLLTTGNVASNERCRRPVAAGAVTGGTTSGGEGVGAWRHQDFLNGCDAVAAFCTLPDRAPDPPLLRLPSRLVHPPSFPHRPHVQTPREHRGVGAGTAAPRRRWRLYVIADRRHASRPRQHRTAGGPLAPPSVTGTGTAPGFFTRSP